VFGFGLFVGDEVFGVCDQFVLSVVVSVLGFFYVCRGEHCV